MSWFKQLWHNSREKGQYFEQQAQKYLIAQGLTPIEQNYYCQFGELDLIMKQDNTLVFIEVKYRKNTSRGGANYALSQTKQQRIKRTIYHYLAAKKLKNQALRIDYIAITGESTPTIKWLKNVF